MIDIETFLSEHSQEIFRYVVYKKVWTPYEQDKKFTDESMYEDGGYYKCATIERGIGLPNGDVLFEFNLIDGETHEHLGEKEFYKLSDIKLSYFDIDNKHIVEYEIEDE